MRKRLLLLAGMLFTLLLAYSQNKEVVGKVLDNKGNPIQDVSVQEKNSKNGTVTNATGAFRLSVRPGTTLVITSVGFGKKEVVVGDASDVAITLSAADASLSEIVVTALGTRKEKKALGYSVSVVSKKDLELRPEGDIARVLTGKAAGVNIVNTSGISGSGTNITIRAVNTITGNSTPLFIVDGVPFDGGTNANTGFTYGNQTSSRFLDLDPNNIENISILKGLSATTIYGELGRNGVILVTTKNGGGVGPIRKLKFQFLNPIL